MNTLLDIIHPTLLLDREICRRNIDRMCSKMGRSDILFRPHFKTHQSREIGRWFRDYGVEKITVSSLRMAAYFADDGWNDITVAFPVNLLEKKIIHELSARIQLNLLVEDPDVIRQLDNIVTQHINVFLKIDTGTHRTGIAPTAFENVDACVEAIEHTSNLRWAGFLSHAGHTYRIRRDRAEMQSVYAESLKGVIALKEHYHDKYPDAMISFGDTPGASIMEDFGNIDEMRPGNFVFYDTMQLQIGSCNTEDVAVALVCPVVATHHERRECIIYGGGIHFSKDSIVREDGMTSYGTLVSYSNGRWDTGADNGNVRSLSQEHGVIAVAASEIPKMQPGELVAVLPVHSCMTAQCMGAYFDEEGRRIDHFASSKYYLQ